MKDEIKTVIQEIVHLLSEHNERMWADQFSYLEEKLEVDYQETLGQVARMFGGAGTFNDFLLHKDGWPLKDENRALFALKSTLYQLVKEASEDTKGAS
ncbi:DUF6966 domain-containing protein [Nissabacter archeti]|uniref:DUF6966 domain-containing protein n=1 Tax=Nissabacter archeti TaxID=1917880 RepID=UPI000932A5FC|nr:hypothetical protein [Nissabacter archeti]